MVPVHLDAATGNITVGGVVHSGATPGMHLLALMRQPDAAHLDQPDVIQDGMFLDASSANQFLTGVLAKSSDAFLIANGVGNYGFALSAIAKNLEQFGAHTDIESIGAAIPFVFLGNGGRTIGQARQRGFSSLNLDGYLAADSNGNYAFIQTDYVQYDLTPDGTIKIGGTAYTVASSYRSGGCTGSNAFHLVVVNREAPNVLIANNSYCTAQSDAQIAQFVTDLGGVTAESELVFMASNGHPIPANWNFGTDGDARLYPLGQRIANFGGYWETIVYMTPQDTYSLVGAPPPPVGTPGASKRARESSSVYPGQPTGELHGVLARGRGNWYSPVNSDPTGVANLGFYRILAQTPVSFPHPANAQELSAFQYISSKLCGSTTCNVRSQYPDVNVSMNAYLTEVEALVDPSTNTNCPAQNPTSPFCIVRQQLLTEFEYVIDIRAFNTNLQTLWLASGSTSILEMLKAYNDLNAQLPAPPASPAPSLFGPILNLFLGVASDLPEIGPLFGLADTAFNFATSLTTDSSGNTASSLSTTVSQLQQQASDQFTAQATTTGTQFDFIYQDWGKISTLGPLLEQAQPGSAWFWDASATGRMLKGMAPAIEQSYYQSLMAALYAIGSYYPVCYLCPAPVNWGSYQIWQQPQAYTVDDPGGPFSPGEVPKAQPFNYPWYPPYTYPSDPNNPIELPSNPAYTEATATLLAANAWLGISALTSPSDSGSNGLYNPPAASILSHLFTPRSGGGLGVYRPAFYETWPFPRVTCQWSDDGDGDMGPGCNWGSAAPSPDALSSPLTKLSIGTGKSKGKFSVRGQIEVPLTIINNGTLELKSIQINNVNLRVLAGSGEAVLADPLLPIKVGDIKPGALATLNLRISVAPGIRKLIVTEEGTLSTGSATPPYKFSFGQAVFPAKQE